MIFNDIFYSSSVFTFAYILLVAIGTRTFYRYFRVNLERPCPFWNEDGQCVYEGCNVCTCDEEEIPRAWLQGTGSSTFVESHDGSEDFGWFSPTSSRFGDGTDGHDDVLGRLDLTPLPYTSLGGGYERYLSNEPIEHGEDHGKVAQLSI